MCVQMAVQLATPNMDTFPFLRVTEEVKEAMEGADSTVFGDLIKLAKFYPLVHA